MVTSSESTNEPTANQSAINSAQFSLPFDLAVLRAAESILVSRSRFENTLSLSSFDGELDYFKQLGYKTSLTNDDYRTLYDRIGLAERFVHILPELTWVEGIYVRETDDPEETEFEQTTNSLLDSLEFRREMYLADVLRSLARYSVIFIGINDGLAPDQPVNSTIRPEQIVYLTAVHEDRAQISRKVTDVKDPRVGLPELYNLKISDSTTLAVHHSRVLHIVDRRTTLDNRYEGTPVLKSVYNDFIGLVRVDDGGCLQQWRSATRVINYDIDPSLLRPPDTAYPNVAKAWTAKRDQFLEQSRTELEEAERGLRSAALTSGITPQAISASVPGFAPNAEYKIKKIASKLGIPWRMLFGAEAGDLASTNDRQMVDDRRKEYVDNHGRHCVRLFVDWLVAHNTLQRTVDTDQPYEVDWPKLYHMSEMEKVETLDKLASANQKQTLSGGAPFLSTDEARDIYLEMEPVDNDQLDSLPDDVADDLEEPDTGLRAASQIDSRSLGKFEPDWKRVHRAADSYQPTLTNLVFGFWQQLTKKVHVDRLTKSMAAKDAHGAEIVIQQAADQLRDDLEQRTEQTILDTIGFVGENLLRSARSNGGFVRPRAVDRQANQLDNSKPSLLEPEFRSLFTMSFNRDNPRALEYAQLHAGNLITEIVDDQITTARELIHRSISEGIPPKKLQQVVRKSFGLRSDQLAAASNLRTELLTAESGTLVTRFPPRAGVRKLAGFRAKVPKGSISTRRAWVEKQLTRYNRMQLNLRARTIGRHEILQAANQGQKELWLQAKEQGALPQTAKKIWIDTGDERERDEHRQMAGQTVELDQPFLLSDGTPIEPGEEVNCRCSQGIVEA